MAVMNAAVIYESRNLKSLLAKANKNVQQLIYESRNLKSLLAGLTAR